MRLVVLILVVIGVATYALASRGPWSQRVAYAHDVDRELARPSAPTLLLEEDLATLPPQVQRYVRQSGAVGEPRVHNVRVRFQGAIRKNASARWMPMSVEQFNHYDEPSRLFFMTASMFAIPFEAYHRYVGASATMRVKLLSAVTVVDARGSQMNTAETVTLLNDMCLLAPGALVDPHIAWDIVDDSTVRATYINAGNRVHATLVFNAEGDLVNFWSDDRWALGEDGKSFEQLRWSTPVLSYGHFGAHRLVQRAEARYQPIGTNDRAGYSYATFDLKDVAYNVTRR